MIVGEALFVRTHEASPLNQSAPFLTALTADAVAITWTAPALANGIITGYTVYRRRSSVEVITVHIGGGQTLSVTDSQGIENVIALPMYCHSNSYACSAILGMTFVFVLPN